jgi:hypothetical protein
MVEAIGWPILFLENLYRGGWEAKIIAKKRRSVGRASLRSQLF